ncbi:MAG: polymer-forming cytoskeletal protein [Candidatus Doudnabacteria bacterium]|nr:polymer-forming cytoskeletal protein [Candidatus Doudnabacteria bacterium]
MARQDNPETIVSSSMRIEGELKSNGDIHIDGTITGKVHTTKDLFVGPNAQIDADILAANATVAGIIRGNVAVKGTLQIMETGKIIGNIACTSLGIREGAYFSGACKMAERNKESGILNNESNS